MVDGSSGSYRTCAVAVWRCTDAQYCMHCRLQTRRCSLLSDVRDTRRYDLLRGLHVVRIHVVDGLRGSQVVHSMVAWLQVDWQRYVHTADPPTHAHALRTPSAPSHRAARMAGSGGTRTGGSVCPACASRRFGARALCARGTCPSWPASTAHRGRNHTYRMHTTAEPADIDLGDATGAAWWYTIFSLVAVWARVVVDRSRSGPRA